MEKRKWLWKRKSSEKSPGETDSSGSISSLSERYSDEQEAAKGFPNHGTQSPEITSKSLVQNEEIDDSIRCLTEKLSAALVNVSAKEDLVKQHAKVAEEAVAGWEKAENEVTVLKQQLDAAAQQNLALEVRVGNLDSALKECVRQLRQAKEEQEARISQAVAERVHEWEISKSELESQLMELQVQADGANAEIPAFVDPDVLLKLEFLEQENASLKHELLLLSQELELRTIDRDLSTQAAETASKQQLESIKKVAKLEAECRRLQAMARGPSSVNDPKSVAASSIYVESLTDSLSDSGEKLNSVEIDTCRMSRLQPSDCEPSSSDSWASALIAELDQFKNEKVTPKHFTCCSIDIDIMDDFLEMERLASLPEVEIKACCTQLEAVAPQSSAVNNSLRTELETMNFRVAELEDKLEKIEAQKGELENALSLSQNSLKATQAQLTEAEVRLVELQREINVLNESKELLEFQLIDMEVEARTMCAKVDSLNTEIDKECSLSAELAAKSQALEDEVKRKDEEAELQTTINSNAELKIKQEDLDAAAVRLAECQKTIASLGRQLQSLATLEDFLIDTSTLPGFAGGGKSSPSADGELWKLHTNGTFMPKNDSDPLKVPSEHPSPSVNGDTEESLASSASTSSGNHVNSTKSRSGFGRLFSRSKSSILIENQQDY